VGKGGGVEGYLSDWQYSKVTEVRKKGGRNFGRVREGGAHRIIPGRGEFQHGGSFGKSDLRMVGENQLKIFGDAQKKRGKLPHLGEKGEEGKGQQS